MSEFRLDAAAIIHPSEQKVGDLLAAFAEELKAQGVMVRGVVQRNTPDPNGGHARMDLIDIETGDIFPISQRLGRAAGSCHLDQSGLTEASAVLRRAHAERPALIIVNRFGEQEATGQGFAAEMLAIMADGIPLLTAVSENWRKQWESFTGGGASLLPASLSAIRLWFDGR
jgi:nucleoside-triphosphatase THEP1